MSTLSKVILGFVILAIIPLFYIASRTLMTLSVHKAHFAAHRNELATVEAKEMKYVDGDPDAPRPSIADLKRDVQQILYYRGRVWRDCQPRPAPNQGELGVLTALPNPPALDVGSIIYLFESTKPGVYLGEFEVSASGPAAGNDPNVRLKPTTFLIPEQAQRLGKSKGPWVMYEKMPADSHNVFAGLTEQQLQPLFPPGYPVARLRTYLQDGEPLDPNADPVPDERIMVQVRFLKDFADLDVAAKAVVDQEKIPEGLVQKDKRASFPTTTAEKLEQVELATEVSRTHHRPLRDYSVLFRELNRQFPVLLDRVAELTSGLQSVHKSVKLGEEDNVKGRAEVQDLEKEQARLVDELAKVSKYAKKLGSDVALYRDAITKLESENQTLAQEWRDLQLNVARRIDAAARAAAP